MDDYPQVLVVGPGALGESVLKGLLGSHRFRSDQIGVIGRNQARLAAVKGQYEVQTFAAGAAAFGGVKAVVLCCKPGDLAVVSAQLAPLLSESPSAVVVSMLAGVTVAQLQRWFPQGQFVRAMPNIASDRSSGVTIWVAAKAVQAEQLGVVRHLLEGLGTSLEVSDERYVDLASPLSGAGPALVALFVECLVDSSVHVGLPRALSRTLVIETIIGSMQVIAAEPGGAVDVRARVTSPGGITTECISTLEQHGFRTAILQSVLAGLRRIGELNRCQVDAAKQAC